LLIQNGKAKSNNKKKAKNKESKGLPNHLRDREELKIEDIHDMLNDSEEEQEAEPSVKRQRLNNSLSDNSGGSSDESDLDEEDDDDQNDESSDDDFHSESENDEGMADEDELQQHNIGNKERGEQKKLKELLPIKTRTGVLPRTTTSDEQQSRRLPKAIPTKALMEDLSLSDNDLQQSDNKSNKKQQQQQQQQQQKKKVMSAMELIHERQQEFNAQKIRIGRACSGITEKPEEKIAAFENLIALMRESNEEGTTNLVSVRKLAMLSIAETFKDIIPDYKVGIVDLENQKVKKDTLARVTYENELLKYYKKYLKELEFLIKSLKPGKYDRRPTKDRIYLGEVAIECMCEVLLAHQYFNFSTNIGQMLVIYLNCSNSAARKKICETFVKVFKTDRRLDLTLHVR
jgi:nucleolar complex protein 3